jgi:hypothetical protein
MQTAMAKNLTEVKNGNLILRADSTTVLDPNGPGRDSIRMQSKKQWTTGVSVFNLVWTHLATLTERGVLTTWLSEPYA